MLVGRMGLTDCTEIFGKTMPNEDAAEVNDFFASVIDAEMIWQELTQSQFLVGYL